MSRPRWSFYAYHVLQPDEQLDLFACRESWLHGVERQLELERPADRTLCGELFPARPSWRGLNSDVLNASTFCPRCRAAINHQRRGVRARPARQLTV